MKRTLLTLLLALLASFSLGGTAGADTTCYTVWADHPDGGEPVSATVCP